MLIREPVNLLNYDLMSQSLAKITIHGVQLLLNSDLRIHGC